MMQIYLVGGAVRDQLLGLPVHEKDWVVVGSTPEALLAQGFKPVGKEFPVFLHPETREEYALARTERKAGQGYKGFTVYAHPEVSLIEDLQRRDLTINAMARSDEGEIIDPYGGQNDLKNRCLRHVSPAFIEDPVRVLRVARFMARLAPLGFRVAPETIECMKQVVAHNELSALIPERIWKEILLALSAAEPVAFIRTLKACHALKWILPEIDALYGIPEPLSWFPEGDAGIHTELALARATALTQDVEVRGAVLFHDIGKSKTPPELWPQHLGSEARSEPMIYEMAERLKWSKSFTQLSLLTAKYHGFVHKADKLSPRILLEVLENTDAFRRTARFEQFLIACKAEALGHLGFEHDDYRQDDVMRQALLAAQRVQIQSLITNQTCQGEALKESIRQVRVAAIHTFLQR